GVFVPKDEALPVLCALLDAWKEDLRYRVSRVKARMKFMVDDYGPEGMRAELERRLGFKLDDSEPPQDPPVDDHMGVTLQHDGRFSVGVPVHLGLASGDQLIAIARLAERHGGDVRITRQQNLVVTGVPDPELEPAGAELAGIGFPLDVNAVRAASIACTGEPHCNFSVTETKSRLGALIDHHEARFGDAIAGL